MAVFSPGIASRMCRQNGTVLVSRPGRQDQRMGGGIIRYPSFPLLCMGLGTIRACYATRNYLRRWGYLALPPLVR